MTGGHAPLDPGDGSGMNPMDLASSDWWEPAVTATAPDLAAKPADSTGGFGGWHAQLLLAAASRIARRAVVTGRATTRAA